MLGYRDKMSFSTKPKEEKHIETQPRTWEARGSLSMPRCPLGGSSSGLPCSMPLSLANGLQEGHDDFTRILPVGKFLEQGSQDLCFSDYLFKKLMTL